MEGKTSHYTKAQEMLMGEWIEAKGLPFVPHGLVEEAQSCMEVIMASMPDDVYSQADTYMLVAFAKAWAIHCIASRKVFSSDFEYVVTSDTGVQKVNPWLKVLDEQARMMAVLGDRLGLNPKARIGIKQPERSEVSKFSGLIGREGSSNTLSSLQSHRA